MPPLLEKWGGGGGGGGAIAPPPPAPTPLHIATKLKSNSSLLSKFNVY